MEDGWRESSGQSGPEELAALVEHRLFNDLVRPPSTDGGVVRPSDFAVLRLMTHSMHIAVEPLRTVQ